MNQNIKKIKAQKNSAVFLSAGAFVILIHRIFKEDFNAHPTQNYIICGALLVIIAVGITGFIRSSRKLKGQQ